MTTIYTSYVLSNAHTLGYVVELVNEGTFEGMEGLEFTSEMLAGQYAWNAASASDYPVDAESIEGHLEFLASEGAKFNQAKAAAHALALVAASAANA